MSEIKAVIWDLDHTLYQHDDTIVEACDMAMAHAVIGNGVAIDLMEAFHLSARSFNETGANYQLFLERYPDLSGEKLHEDYHRILDENIIKPFEKLPNLFAQQPDLQHFILTHSSAHWAQRVTKFIGLENYFPDENIIDLKGMGYTPKHENPDILDRIVNLSGVNGAQIAMVEDTVRNLEPAKERGLVTILVHNNEDIDDIPDFVDHVVEDANAAMELIEKLNNPQALLQRRVSPRPSGNGSGPSF